MTPNFDFIIDADFRQSLESDYVEMDQCIEGRAWKSTQVIAGSIIEALLIDYLAASKHPKRPAKDPLRLDLAEAITICREEKVLTSRTADLSSVIRSFRNLIHPGRVKRLEEPRPNEGSAIIARKLVDLIVDEVAKVRRSTFGLTAEQIVMKLERDGSSLGILKELLLDVHESEKERLLLAVIPERYFALGGGSFPSADPEATTRLSKAFRTLLAIVSEKIQQRTASQFVTLIREANGERVMDYRTAFFKADDIERVDERHRKLVVQHYLATSPTVHTPETASEYARLAAFIQKSDVVKWVDPFVRTILRTATASDDMGPEVRLHFNGAFQHTPSEVDEATRKRLDAWIKKLEDDGNEALAAEVRDLKSDTEPDFPF